MGYTPQEIEAMSVWQFNAVALGWARQYETSGISEHEADELWTWLQKKDDVPLAHARPN